MFKNERHKALFEEAVRKKNKKDNRLMAVIYLFTADFRLWNIVKHYVDKTSVNFAGIKLRGIHENGYTLYSAAKEIYTGIKNLCIADLIDKELIPTNIFILLCNAMIIKRNGLDEIKSRGRLRCDDKDNGKE